MMIIMIFFFKNNRAMSSLNVFYYVLPYVFAVLYLLLIQVQQFSKAFPSLCEYIWTVTHARIHNIFMHPRPPGRHIGIDG